MTVGVFVILVAQTIVFSIAAFVAFGSLHCYQFRSRSCCYNNYNIFVVVVSSSWFCYIVEAISC